jgi:hypothetical protein
VGKALGQGLAGGPHGLIASAVDIHSGTILLRLAGELARRFPNLDGVPLAAQTSAEEQFVVAGALWISGAGDQGPGIE